jgi:hypothetical protein
MTFTWNVPGGTAEPAIVVRTEAPPGDVVRAALYLLDVATELAADAMGEDGPPAEDLRLEDDAGDLVLHIMNQDGNWGGAIKAAQPRLAALGITRVVCGEWVTREYQVPEKKPVNGVDNPV